MATEGQQADPSAQIANAPLSSSTKSAISSAGNSPPSDPHLADDNDGDYKLCRICGDKALGYNFNVISCESCKAFFRRNANKSKDFRCPSNNNCTITVASRRFCQRCRLTKCFDEGMKKEWIMSEDALMERRQRNEDKKFDHLRIPLISDVAGIRRAYMYDLAADVPPARRFRAGPSLSDDPNLFFRNPVTYAPGFNPSSTSLAYQQSPWYSDITGSPIAGFARHQAMATFHIAERSAYGHAMPNSANPFGIAVPIASQFAQSAHAAPYIPALIPTVSYQHTLTDQQQHSRQVHVSSTLTTDSPIIYDKSPTHSSPGSTRLTLPCKEASQTQNEGDYVYVPKAVLANLVSQCYSMIRAQSSDSHESITQIQEQQQLCLRVLALIQDQASQDRPSSSTCICPCVCGASTGIDSEKSIPRLGIDIRNDQDTQKSGFQDQVHLCGKAGSKNSAAWLSLDEQDSAIWHESPLDPHQSATAMPGMTLFMWLRMEELIAANRSMDEPRDFALLENGTRMEDAESATDVTRMTNICVLHIIRMCKRIGAFKTLCQEDQIALLKGSCAEILILRGVMAYIPERDAYDGSCYPAPQAQLESDGPKDCYKEHKEYVKSFEEALRRDERIMLLLGALALFSPRRRNTVHENVVSREHDFYHDLLRSYLGITFGPAEAQRCYLLLCDRLNTLHQRVHEYAATIFRHVNPRNLEPLVLEVIDLNDYEAAS